MCRATCVKHYVYYSGFNDSEKLGREDTCHANGEFCGLAWMAEPTKKIKEALPSARALTIRRSCRQDLLPIGHGLGDSAHLLHTGGLQCSG